MLNKNIYDYSLPVETHQKSNINYEQAQIESEKEKEQGP
jgi:hypothetical protein